jgi:hypothetical protein
MGLFRKARAYDSDGWHGAARLWRSSVSKFQLWAVFQGYGV